MADINGVTLQAGTAPTVIYTITYTKSRPNNNQMTYNFTISAALGSSGSFIHNGYALLCTMTVNGVSSQVRIKTVDGDNWDGTTPRLRYVSVTCPSTTGNTEQGVRFRVVSDGRLTLTSGVIDTSSYTVLSSPLLTTACGAPTSCSVSPVLAEGGVTLSWSGASSGISNTISSYEIQYSESTDNFTWGAWMPLTTVSTTATSGSVATSPPSTRGNYRRFQVTYTFVNALGSPATNNVQVLIQDTLRDTVKIIAKAIRGIEDETNIVYGSDTNPNPACTAYWTSQRFSIGDTTVAPGESLFLLEKAENATAALTLTSTATASINSFTREPHVRYVMSGNVSGAGGINSVRGPLHTVLPIDSVVIGGQSGLLFPAAYDCHLVTLCRQSDTSEKEFDLYISNDEQNFTRICRSTPIGNDSNNEAQHIQIVMRQARVPAGYGLYVCMGSNGTSSTAYCDLKFTYHLYPTSLATDINT